MGLKNKKKANLIDLFAILMVMRKNRYKKSTLEQIDEIVFSIK